MMITGVGTAICQVEDMDRSVAFYRDLLGLRAEHVTPYWSSVFAGSFRIGLHPAFEGSMLPYAEPGKGWTVVLSVDDIAGLRAKLEAAGVLIRGDYHDTPGGVILNFVDPDGHNLQAMQEGAKAAEVK